MVWGTDIEFGIIHGKFLRKTDFSNQFNQNMSSFNHIIMSKLKHILQAPFDQTKMFKHLNPIPTFTTIEDYHTMMVQIH